MSKNLRIDKMFVDVAVNDLSNQLTELESVRSKYVIKDLGAGWSSANAQAVNRELEAFDASIISIKTSIDKIREAVSQYSTNVGNVDASVSLNTNKG